MDAGVLFPGARDSTSVQFYISTVIRSGKIYQNINFVVEWEYVFDQRSEKVDRVRLLIINEQIDKDEMNE